MKVHLAGFGEPGAHHVWNGQAREKTWEWLVSDKVTVMGAGTRVWKMETSPRRLHRN